MEAQTIIVNQTNFELYRDIFRYFFILETTDFEYEGEIILGSGNHGGESYSYVSHVEFSSDDEMEEEEQEIFEKYLDDNINDVLKSEQI